jgi:hypothetical protein
MRRMVEPLKGEGKKRTVILPSHLLLLALLKHLTLFSVDTVEKKRFLLQNDENQSRADVAQLYIPSIENV